MARPGSYTTRSMVAPSQQLSPAGGTRPTDLSEVESRSRLFHTWALPPGDVSLTGDYYPASDLEEIPGSTGA